MGKMLTCYCGEVIRGTTDDEVMENGAKHGKEKHPDKKLSEEEVQQLKASIKDE